MPKDYTSQIALELGLPKQGVKNTIELLDAGSTVPFISRYRKEATGSLDEVAVTSIRDRLRQLRELNKRKEVVLASIKEQGKLTDALKKKIEDAQALGVLEDLYLPYKPKRRTRATIAKEKGLEGLAKFLFVQGEADPEKEALKYIDKKKKVENIEQALAGARDVIAEWINENAQAREKIRTLYFEKGKFCAKAAKGKEKEAVKYKDYFNWQEPVKTVVSHRMLAARRGEKEKMLSLSIKIDESEAVGLLEKLFVKNNSKCAFHVRMAADDGFKRLLSTSIETETRLAAKEKADKEAVAVFSKNLRQLLMAPPLGQKNIMAIDPGYRTGCKVVCLDRQGSLLEFQTIYPSHAEKNEEKDRKIVQDLCRKYKVEFLAIGNGTASRETEEFIKNTELPEDIPVAVVSESGASIYSASEVAREELPDYDVTVRGAVSIGRRVMDPLSELVKIDPKSIGVGQYQHDVDQKLLKRSLDDVVVSCVNMVGVDINTASKQLLTYVSGLGPTRAQAIMDYRIEHGNFASREELYNVKNLGSKAVEQAAGFLRIRNGKYPLDASAVHPESYHIVDRMARDLNCPVEELLKNEAKRSAIQLKKYVTENIGLPTLQDIYSELSKPGRDPREKFEVIQFTEGVSKPEDLAPGMKLPGVVTNITKFGVFVDIGVHLDGLLHISQMSDKFVKDPNDLFEIAQRVEVTIMEVDLQRKRIALTLKNLP